jgi:leucyl aminopeptidase
VVPGTLTDVPDADVWAVGFRSVDDQLVLGAQSDAVADLLPAPAQEVLARAKARGAVGEVVEVPLYDSESPVSVLLVGLGAGTATDLRRAGAALARRVRGRSHLAVSLGADCLGGDLVPSDARADAAALRALVEGLVLGSFSFDLKTQPGTPAVGAVTLTGVGDGAEPAVRRGRVTAHAAWFSRALALTPSSIKSPAWLAEQAVEVAREHDLTCEVWDEDALRRDGFGGLLAVGQASDHESRLVRLDYEPEGAGKRTPHVVLVGKGITFDTGGLSLKPSDAMAPMKRDMSGAGVVLAAMAALRDLGCPVRVTGLLMCAENAVGGGALRPGDVIRHYGGRTTEVTNTDAEGRLVLADGMAYAVDVIEPDVVVDVATLTGAVRIALGQRLGGLFTDDDDLAEELVRAGRASGEPLWRLPMVDDYLERIDSTVADADNAGGTPGAITAALFLRPFAGDVRWAHLDLASVGDSPSDQFEWTQGATGFGARLLLQWLCV